MLQFKSILVILIFALCTGCAAYRSFFRETAESDLEFLRLDQTDSLLPEEFRSIEDTIRKADHLGKIGQYEISERYYRLAYAKTELLKKNLEYVDKNIVVEREPGENEPNATISAAPLIERADPDPAIAEPGVNPADDDAGKDASEGAPAPDPSLCATTESPLTVLSHLSAPPVFPATPAIPVSPEIPVANSPATAPSAIIAAEPGKSRTEWANERAVGLIGRETVYVVKDRETLKMVSAKTGVSWRVIARENGLDPKKPLEPGRSILINTMRIVPKTFKNGILINIPDKTLYLFKDGRLQRTFPVGLGMGKLKDISSWETPTGKFKIISKVKDPKWYIPYSIQQKLKKEGKDFLTVVPPGPKNPLGKYALCTNIGGILIHSTTNPESINSFRSHGCIRLLPGDMEKFFNTVRINTSGEIIYEPVKAVVSENGRVLLEVHADPYNRIRDLEAETRRVLQKMNVIGRVDWKKVRVLLKNGYGMVEDITNSM